MIFFVLLPFLVPSSNRIIEKNKCFFSNNNITFNT